MGNKIDTTIKNIGKMAYGLINNNYLVLFDKDDEFNIFGCTVEPTELKENIEVGDIVVINNNEYKVKKLSDKFNENIRNNFQFELIIDREFDGENQILLEGSRFPEIREGTEIIIKEN